MAEGRYVREQRKVNRGRRGRQRYFRPPFALPMPPYPLEGPRNRGWRRSPAVVHSENPDLRDEPRSHPGHRTGWKRPRRERWASPPNRREPPIQRLERRPVVAGSHFAGVPQLVALVESHQERAQAFAGALRRRVSADHEFLLVDALDLEPVGRPSAHILRRRTLRDDALRPARAGLAQHRRGAPRAERGEHDDVVVSHHVPQYVLPLDQRKPGDVGPLGDRGSRRDRS